MVIWGAKNIKWKFGEIGDIESLDFGRKVWGYKGERCWGFWCGGSGIGDSGLYYLRWWRIESGDFGRLEIMILVVG